MTDQGELLKAICDEVIADRSLQPSAGITHCSEGARKIAQTLGCNSFDDLSLRADDMVNIMSCGGFWSQVSGSDATIHALSGGLAFAAMTSERLGESHGHIAAIYPIGMGYSGSLSKDVPYVANVGRGNGEEKVSQAFPPSKGEPGYWKWEL